MSQVKIVLGIATCTVAVATVDSRMMGDTIKTKCDTRGISQSDGYRRGL